MIARQILGRLLSTSPFSRSFRVVLIAASILATAFSSSLSAQEDDSFTMNMRDADIRALIQWVADRTQKNIIVHKDVKGKVTVLSAQPLNSEEAYRLFLSVLQVHGYAAIETGDSVKIVPKALASSSALPSLANASGSSDMVVSLIKMRYASATKLADTLRPLLSKEAIITPYADSNALIITDHASNIEAAKALVAKLDSSNSHRIEMVKLKHADAIEVMEGLKNLLPQGAEDLSISVDSRSNSILLAGEAGRRQQVRQLLAQLDKPIEGSGNTDVVYLHYIDAKELAPILKNLAQGIQTNQQDTTSISIEASESANALVLNAPPSVLSTLKRVIDQLDIRRAQVLIEAVVVEVSGNVDNDLGVTWVTDPEKELIAGINTLGDLPLVNLSAAGDDESGSTSVDSVDIGTVGRGFTFGYFDNGNLQAAIRALNATQNANILSTPTIVALDNEEASLLVGQNVPFITGQSTGSASDTDNPFTTIERQDIGITLDVTPRINEGDSITLEIKQKTENVSSSLVASDIITNKREIITKVLIKDEQILVLGGLMSDEENEVQDKVPLLGDLPLIGKLFSSTSKSVIKQNLMVFIHPIILKDEEHMRSISQQRYNFMKNLRQRAADKEWKAGDESELKMQDFESYGQP